MPYLPQCARRLQGREAAKSAGTFAHQVLSQKRGADEMENSEKLEEPQGNRVNVSSGAEQQEGEDEDEILEGGVEGEMEEE